jgi:hypothetical protein
MEHVFSINKSREFNEVDNEKFGRDINVTPPYLVSPNNTAYGSSTNSNGTIINGSVVDVVNDFYWTYSKLRESRQEVPRVILTEKRQKVNTLISQLKYSFGATLIVAQDTLNQLSQNPLVKELFGNNNFIGTASNAVGNARQSSTQFAETIVPELRDNNPVFKNNPLMKPYENLYITEDTGWKFILPYFDNYSSAQANVYSGDSNANFSGIAKMAADGLNNATDIISTLSKSTDISFVEKAKLYNYSTEGEEISFTFPLINTGSATFEDVVRNWELLFLLLYNNKPSRRSVSIVDPPVLYQLDIPGVKFLPFCYVSNIAIEFQGSRRELEFNLSFTDNLKTTNIPFQLGEENNSNTLNNFSTDQTFNINAPPRDLVGTFFSEAITRATTTYKSEFYNNQTSRKIKTIVPDAYLIRITVKSLLAETKNFMYSLVNSNPTVTTSSTPFGVNF